MSVMRKEEGGALQQTQSDTFPRSNGTTQSTKLSQFPASLRRWSLRIPTISMSKFWYYLRWLRFQQKANIPTVFFFLLSFFFFPTLFFGPAPPFIPLSTGMVRVSYLYCARCKQEVPNSRDSRSVWQKVLVYLSSHTNSLPLLLGAFYLIRVPLNRALLL